MAKQPAASALAHTLGCAVRVCSKRCSLSSRNAAQKFLGRLVNAPADGSCRHRRGRSARGVELVLWCWCQQRLHRERIGWQHSVHHAESGLNQRRSSAFSCLPASLLKPPPKGHAPDGAWKSTRGCQPRHSAAAPSSRIIRCSTGRCRQAGKAGSHNSIGHSQGSRKTLAKDSAPQQADQSMQTRQHQICRWSASSPRWWCCTASHCSSPRAAAASSLRQGA